MAESLKVVNISDQLERLRSEIVTVDFMEFDHMRIFVKRAVANLKGRNRYPRGAYEHSNFYIGRSVTRLSFFQLYCSHFQMNMLRKVLKAEMREPYKYYIQGNDLHVYLRGEPANK